MEKRFTLVALVAAAVLMVAPFVVPNWQMEILTLALSRFLAVLAVALFLRAGLVNFGHALFYGVGAYTVGFASKWFDLREALFIIPMGALTGAIVAALVGLVGVRIHVVPSHLLINQVEVPRIQAIVLDAATSPRNERWPVGEGLGGVPILADRAARADLR